MDENALPQRPNARCRMRAQQLRTDEPPSAEATAFAPLTSSGRTAGERSEVAHAPAAGVPRKTGPVEEAPDATESGAGGSGGPTHMPTREEALLSGAAAAGGAEAAFGVSEEIPRTGGDGGEEVLLPAYRSAAVEAYKFEYLDHTADVQLHAWGRTLTEAFENCALAMFNYMSPLAHVRPRTSRSYRAEGHDLQSLLFAFLDELLFVFCTDLFLAAIVRITSFDRINFVIEAEGMGETFDRKVHEAGTEIKAITFSAMSIVERLDDDAEVFVIVDI